jgi:glycosyltransferase involved in cell wall biosynthesis
MRAPDDLCEGAAAERYLIVGNRRHGWGGAQRQQRLFVARLPAHVTREQWMPALSRCPGRLRGCLRAVWLNAVVLRHRPTRLVLWGEAPMMLAPYVRWHRRLAIYGAERTNPNAPMVPEDDAWRARAMRSCDVVLAQTHRAAEAIERFAGCRTALLPNIVDDSLQARADTLRTSAVPVLRSRTVVWAGRMEPVKAVEVVVRAFAVLHASDSEWRLLLIGDGSCEAALRAEVQALGLDACVEFAGRRDHAEVLDAMATTRIFAFSSVSEGYANVVMEAALLGDAVVSTDCDFGPREILADRPRTWLVPVGDEVAFTAALREAAATTD